MIKTNKIELVFVWIYVFLVFISSDIITVMIASLFLLSGFLLSSLNRRTVLLRWNVYYTIQLVFIAYCLLQVIFGVAILKNRSLNMIELLLINCIDEILLFNILAKQDNVEDVLNSLIYPFAIGLITILIIQFRSGMLLSTRLSSGFGEETIYKIMGIKISAGSATIVGHCALCAFTLSLINYYSSKNKKYALLCVICLMALLFSVSRKGYVAAFGIFIIIPELFAHNSKRLRRIFGAVLLFVIAVVIVMNTPALYNLIGRRITSLFLSRGGNTVDYSLSLRERFRIMAWTEFLVRPISGWGLDSFKYYFNNGWLYSHSNYLELLVGTGLIGTSLFLTKYVVLLRNGITIVSSVKRENPRMRSFLMSLIVWLIVVWIIEYWQVAYYNERMIVHYTVILAAFTSLKKQVGKRATVKIQL